MQRNTTKKGAIQDTSSPTIFFAQLPIYHYDCASNIYSEISPYKPIENIILQKPLKIVTWNVLFDEYTSELIHTKQRIPIIIQYLKQMDADIIGLQEVTRPFLIELLRQEWVKNQYFISDSQ